MKILRFDFNFNFVKDSNEIPTELNKYFSQLILLALRIRFKDGLTMESQRRLYKICDKLETCLDNSIELEDAEFELIDDAFKNAKFSPDMNRVLVQVYDFLDEAKLRKDTKN